MRTMTPPATGSAQQHRSGVATPGGAQTAPAAMPSSSPPAAAHHGHEEHLASALHAALRSLSGHHHPAHDHTDHAQSQSHSVSHSPPTAILPTPPVPPHPHPPKETHGHTKSHTNLDIQVVSDTLVLRGAGVDVEPALLQGNVVLTLSEPTSIRQVTLVFRGKARVPAGGATSGDPCVFFPCYLPPVLHYTDLSLHSFCFFICAYTRL